ncbi:putative glutamate--cysteine ligase 2 [Pseudomonas tohonis]|uniref:Putative glutamate--cysteine ligase 2 n=1 Tax=Pseudomonas tohonis TaxID=2725477 RepID=A0A6J4E6W1_9PSED|nr:carboxylate-amine ligase [Pseudomonas tohonis]BCG25350.1 putative glutamate--cysteine ligase 2 [Pseudomonas tohonis]GJN54820.1 putative glutamate--cysteine ligase 2 [Pseudomonas tohonis]
MTNGPPSGFGIEEEYFVVDLETRELARGPLQHYVEACRQALGAQLATEMFTTQIEIATPVLHGLEEARGCLARARATLDELGRPHGLGILAVGTHPLGGWRQQQGSASPRYQELFEDYQLVARRSLLSGLHVHVGIAEGLDRIRVMNRVTPWLPLLLVLGASSPFWEGRPSGLLSYRQAACGEWPRMGIPEHFEDEAAYGAYRRLLLEAGLVRDEADVWWTLRPSARYPTLELRIADACPRLEDVLCIAGLFRAMVAFASSGEEPAWVRDPLTRLITRENHWQAMRHGRHGRFLDPLTRTSTGLREWLEQVLGLIGPEAQAAGDGAALERARWLAEAGSGAEFQLGFQARRCAEGRGEREALVDLVDELLQQTRAG